MRQLSLILSLFLLCLTTKAQCLEPNLIAQQYLKDITSLDEYHFVLKYTLDKEGFMYIYNHLRHPAYDRQDVQLSDSLKIRSEINSGVVNSYRLFKEYYGRDSFDVSLVEYKTCFYEIEYENDDVRIVLLDDLDIHFKVDTLYYVLRVENLFQVNNRWIGGRCRALGRTDSNYDPIESDYTSEYTSEVDYTVVDTVAAYSDIDYTKSVRTSSKADKLQKKIDALNQKLNLLYRKQEEEMY